ATIPAPAALHAVPYQARRQYSRTLRPRPRPQKRHRATDADRARRRYARPCDHRCKAGWHPARHRRWQGLWRRALLHPRRERNGRSALAATFPCRASTRESVTTDRNTPNAIAVFQIRDPSRRDCNTFTPTSLLRTRADKGDRLYTSDRNG